MMTNMQFETYASRRGYTSKTSWSEKDSNRSWSS